MNNVILTILVIALSFALGMVISHSMSARKKKAEITTDFLESNRATSCGVVTMTAPSALGISWTMDRASSPVPGGMSITR